MESRTRGAPRCPGLYRRLTKLTWSFVYFMSFSAQMRTEKNNTQHLSGYHSWIQAYKCAGVATNRVPPWNSSLLVILRGSLPPSGLEVKWCLWVVAKFKLCGESSLAHSRLFQKEPHAGPKSVGKTVTRFRHGVLPHPAVTFWLLSFQDSETFSERHAVQFVRKEGEIKHQNYSHTGKQM